MNRFLDFRSTRSKARRLTAAAAAFAIVLSQLAVAAHACMLPTTPVATAAATEVSVSARDCDCPTAAAESAAASALCKQHCENGQQNIVKPVAFDLPATLLVLAIPLPPVLAVAQTAIRPDYVAGAPPPTPPFLQSSILRI